MAEDSRAIVTEVDDAIAVIRFNRPHERNPLSLHTLQTLDTNLGELTNRGDVAAIVFTGTADVFASGADIRELASLNPTSAFEFAKRGQSLFQAISDMKQLTIAAINGFCLGGGLDLALACALRIASKSAVFSHPGATRGIITGWGGTQRLPRLIGHSRAIEFFATAGRYSAESALEIGLVNYVGDPAIDHAVRIAREAKKKVAESLPPSRQTQR
jgi:enoyl-CoA hydratase/carnithine racemase